LGLTFFKFFIAELAKLFKMKSRPGFDAENLCMTQLLQKVQQLKWKAAIYPISIP